MSGEAQRPRCPAEIYLTRSGWKKDACGWWTSPFGYGLDEAIALHKAAAEQTAHAFNNGSPDLLAYWLKSESHTDPSGAEKESQ